ncbi:MAG: DUF421 domain-containing protein [Clostridia bacterium]|nr:DUF421 domain-containing protein [Clostridia bacterium]
MLVLFLRSVFLYLLIFAIIRLTGKRQLSDIQPFDLVVTLLIADLASEPASDTSVPLVYGVVPILALFLMQRLFAFLSLKSVRIRKLVCGSALIVIEKGVIVEGALKKARYTLDDLFAQLRLQGVFSITEVEYAIIETGGDMSVLLRGASRPPTCDEAGVPPSKDGMPAYVVEDGVVHDDALSVLGYDLPWMYATIKKLGCKRPDDMLYMCVSPDGHVTAQRRGSGSLLRLDGAV